MTCIRLYDYQDECAEYISDTIGSTYMIPIIQGTYLIMSQQAHHLSPQLTSNHDVQLPHESTCLLS